MAKTKKEIEDFISNYLSYSFDDSDYAVEGITRYVGLNKEKIIQDKETIIEFFVNNLCLGERDYSSMLYGTVLKDDKDNVWNNLESMDDLELLDEVIALGIAADVFIDRLYDRFYTMRLLGQSAIFLLPEMFRFNSISEEEAYLTSFKNTVAAKGYILKNVELLDKYLGIDETKELYKELLDYWWVITKDASVPDETIEIFRRIVNSLFDDIVNVVVSLNISNQGAKELYDLMLIPYGVYNLISEVHYKIESFSPEEKERFENIKKNFFDKLKRRYDADQKKKKL